jgi:hypothetical protein|tara:strand:- start:100 stop:702 length:603 start_codon:yes stop_codon:yes gene_type:complete
MIHTFGDSHASNTISGWKDCNDIITHHLGAKLCYTFGREILNLCDIRKYDINDGDSLIFCFGEIDCRCHVHKHITATTPYRNVIDSIIDSYITAININIYNSDINFKNICIYNVVPPIERYNTYENIEQPYLGSDQERKQYVLYFNQILREKCNENNWVFFDIYNKYIDNNGYLNKQLSDGNVHIKNGIHIQEFITNNLM